MMPVLPSLASLKCPFANVCILLLCLFCSPNLCLTLGEGAINLALAQSRSQDVRINGPLGASTAMRMDTGFPMQGGQGNSPQGFPMHSGDKGTPLRASPCTEGQCKSPKGFVVALQTLKNLLLG